MWLNSMMNHLLNDPNKAELSKAVLTLTKHKHRLEEEHLRLLEQMARTQQELDFSHQETDQLRSRLLSTQNLVAELQKKSPQYQQQSAPGEDRRGGGTLPHLKQQMLRGLSSLVTAPESSIPGAPSSIGATVALGQEELGKLVEENESLHRKLLDTQSALDNTLAMYRREISEREEWKIRSEQEFFQLRNQMMDLNFLFDRVYHEFIVDKSMLHVLEHFFKFSLSEIVFPKKDSVDFFLCQPEKISKEFTKKHELDSSRALQCSITTTSSSFSPGVDLNENESNGKVEKSQGRKDSVHAGSMGVLDRVPPGVPLGACSFLPSVVELSLQLPSPPKVLDTGLLEGKGAVTSIASWSFYLDTFLRISGAFTIWITTIKKLLPLELQRNSFSAALTGSGIASPLSQGHEKKGRIHLFQPPPTSLTSHEKTMTQGHLKEVLDRLGDLYAQHIHFTKQITCLWESVLEVASVERGGAQMDVLSKTNQDKGCTLGKDDFKSQRLPRATFTHKRAGNEKTPEPTWTSVLSSSCGDGLISTRSIGVGAGRDENSDADEEEGVGMPCKSTKEERSERVLSSTVPQQVFLCLLLLKLVKSLMRWVKMLSQYLPLLQLGSESLSTVGLPPSRSAFSTSQRGTSTGFETATNPSHIKNSERGGCSGRIYSTSCTFSSAVECEKVPFFSSATEDHSKNNSFLPFPSPGQSSNHQRPNYFQEPNNDHHSPSQSMYRRENFFAPPYLTSSLHFPTQNDPAAPITLEPCGRVVLLTIQGVLRRMRALLVVLWNDYLRENTQPLRDDKEVQIPQISQKEGTKLISHHSSLSLISHILSPSTLLATLSLVWKAIRTSPDLFASIQALSLAFHHLAARCDIAHLRNVYHLLNREIHQFAYYQSDTGLECRGISFKETDNKSPLLGVLSSSVHQTSSLGSTESRGRRDKGGKMSTRWKNNVPLPENPLNSQLRTCWSKFSLREEKYSDGEKSVVLYLLSLLDEVDAVSMDQQHQLGAALWELAESRDALMNSEAKVEYLLSCLHDLRTEFSSERDMLQNEIWRLSDHLASAMSSQSKEA